MKPAARLHPTLWRTCRAIANPTRLAIFAFLLEHRDQSVSAVAARFQITLSAASQQLRLLESRGLLTVRRSGKWVKYRIAPPDGENSGSLLAAAIRWEFQRNTEAAQTVFKWATAFTHPRRIKVICVLQSGTKTFDQLQVICQIPFWALYRHLKKLEARGFISQQANGYVVVAPSAGLRRELVRLAVSDAALA